VDRLAFGGPEQHKAGVEQALADRSSVQIRPSTRMASGVWYLAVALGNDVARRLEGFQAPTGENHGADEDGPFQHSPLRTL